MKLKRLGALLLTMTMCFLTSCSNPASADESSAENAVIRVGVSGDFYPFCYQENDQLKGFEVDMWDYIAEQNGWEVEYTVADFSGLFGMLDTGRIDTVARQTSSDNEARREKYLFSDVYLYSTYNLVVRADSELEELEDFKGTRIGVVMGGDGELNLKKLNEENDLGIEIVGYEGTPAMDSDIEMGRIDGRVAPMLQTKMNIEQNGQDFKITDNVVYTEAAAYPFQKDNTELAEAVNATLQQMRESGKLSELSEQWFGRHQPAGITTLQKRKYEKSLIQQHVVLGQAFLTSSSKITDCIFK